MTAGLFLVLGCGVPLAFYLLASPKNPARAARVKWQMMFVGATLGFAAAAVDFTEGRHTWPVVVSTFLGVALLANGFVEMRKSRLP